MLHTKTHRGNGSTGSDGEDRATEYLISKGYKIIDRNYLRKWGEIDIVAEKESVLRFIEVKSVSADTYRPEENMHPGKLKRLSRVIQTYLLSKKIDKDWQLDLITVRLDMKTRLAKVEIIENIII